MSGVYTPVEGTAPGAALRFSRGYIVCGVAHAVPGDAVASGSTVTAACGRKVIAHAVYAPDAWPRMRAQPHATHETGVCRRCVDRTPAPS